MGNKYSRAGGKFTGNHTTLAPLACQVCDLANKLPVVTSISPGLLKPGLKSVNGNRRVQIREDNGGILLTVRDNTSLQEVRIYTKDVHEVRLGIIRWCLKEKIKFVTK